MNLDDQSALIRNAVIVGAAAVIGLSGSVQPEPAGTEYFNEVISEKQYTPASWYGANQDVWLSEAWYIRFDYSGGWTCFPVSEVDFGRLREGQRVLVRWEPGELAEILRVG